MSSFEGIPTRRVFSMVELGCILQRLFSTFPNSWPGLGLFLLRLGLAIALLYFAVVDLCNPPETTVFVQALIAGAGGVFLLAGLWTPVTGTLVALDEILITFSSNSWQGEHMWSHIFLAIQALSLAMLGPGAWSLDARLFGRKRFDIARARGRKPSF